MIQKQAQFSSIHLGIDFSSSPARRLWGRFLRALDGPEIVHPLSRTYVECLECEILRKMVLSSMKAGTWNSMFYPMMDVKLSECDHDAVRKKLN